jgi:hypothetical protein
MKLNQFTVSVVVESAHLKQTNQGINILELVAGTPDGKHVMGFTAFKEKAVHLHTAMKPGQTWLVTGSLSGRRYQTKAGGTGLANGALINEAVMLQDAVPLQPGPSFGEEDIPF